MRRRDGNHYLCLFQTQAFEIHYGGLYVSREESLPWELAHDTVLEGTRESKRVFLNYLAKPLPQVIRFPLCRERDTGSDHQTGSLG